MNTRFIAPFLLATLAFAAPASAWADASADVAASPSLTIYNQQFAVVRQTIPLSLTQGFNQVSYSNITCHVEPDSVILRDPSGQSGLRVREQNYRGDVISQDLLLSLYEGKSIQFEVKSDPPTFVEGKIIRSGYVPHTNAYTTYGSGYQYTQQLASQSATPLIEVDGRLQFSLPGTPVFPALTDDSILKPELDWTVVADKPGPVNAELAYVTGGMNWTAAYNVVAPENGQKLELTGWVTIDNESGATFTDAKIKLMAGDVNKIQPQQQMMNGLYLADASFAGAARSAGPAVTQKAFDEYHLYALADPTTLRDRETKQVEFVSSSKIASRTIYIYDGLDLDSNQYYNWGYDSIRNSSEYGTKSRAKVAVAREFDNTEANGLGVPLPAGRIRFYRRDSDGQLEFTGENTIDHTPKDETIRVITGDAFDLVGSRTQTNYSVDSSRRVADESFAIDLKNHKTEPVDIRVVEHLYRGDTWTITDKSTDFVKKDSATIEFPIRIAAGGEQIVTYTAHYTW
jgi:hypothetical protein